MRISLVTDENIPVFALQTFLLVEVLSYGQQFFDL